MIYPVILVGGSGTRLWPLSRESRPKPFWPLAHPTQSLLQQTLLRLTPIEKMASPLLLCNARQRFHVAAQLQEIAVEPRATIVEPIQRNTCAAIAIAALELARHDPQATMLLLHADQIIADVPAFARALALARAAAQDGAIALFGIVPDRAETGFGYIQSGRALDALDGISHVARFVEKPDLATAREYVAHGDYWWNSGMFVARVDTLLQEIENRAPQVLAACRVALEHADKERDFWHLNEAAFARCPSLPIESAVLEKTARCVVVPVAMGWSDVGSWAALWQSRAKDDAGNVAHGDAVLRDTRDCLVWAASRLVVTLGVQDLVVVETADAVLVAHRDAAQDVKAVVEALQAQSRAETA